MAEYFYTLDLGQTYGPKLQAQAAQASFEDVEAFAAMILCMALDSMESCERAEAERSGERQEIGGNSGSVASPGEEDSIPF